jgi:hypothetical protein
MSRLLERTHDLRLPAWGPYTKRYMGVSHIPNVAQGLRFDLSVIPGFYRGSVAVPNVKWESGYHPWEASSDLSYYCHRHELVWKDRVYVDVSFSGVDERTRLIRCECVNQTELAQTLVLHYVASLHFPPLRANSDEAIRPTRVTLPDGAVWVGALDYDELRYATPRPTDNLVPDGMYRGEVRDHGFVDGTGVGRGYGSEMGDRLTYSAAISHAFNDGVLLIRCRVADGERAHLRLGGLVDHSVSVSGGAGFQLVRVSVGLLEPGICALTIVSEGTTPIELDGYVLCEAVDEARVRFDAVSWCPEAQISAGPVPNSLRLSYDACRGLDYGLAWGFAPYQVRQLYGDELDSLMRRTVHNHVSAVIRDVWAPSEPVGHYVDVYLLPIALAPRSQRVVYGWVCCGSGEEVERRLAELDLGEGTCEAHHTEARCKVVDLNSGRKTYRFSQERMAATVLTNVVYPVRLRDTYVRHNTPGRWWDSLYTWDSGFIGLGLLELDVERAIDCLNAYVTEPGDPHAAFIHHGSPVPVQFYLFLEIWNRTRDRELLAHFYPRLRQYYLFLAGKTGSSTTADLESGLLKTWDYFYNSGGWDDYPPQVFVHRQGLEATVTPVVTTAHCIRVAKILGMMARALGCAGDVAEYAADVNRLTHALQTYSWDPEAGYFSYVLHDDTGNPQDLLRHESGENYNRGLDGACPLIAGACTPDQEDRLLVHLQDRRRHWTDVGLSTVDRSAPYYREDGYWNGAVWMPHQWFFWKTCLDLGRGAFAWQIARTALDVWRREVEETYNCYEHFIVSTGRGAGWHHFSGLSAPVLSWHGAYCRPGRLTCGLDVWVDALRMSDRNRGLEARLRTYGRSGQNLQVIASLDPEQEYAVTWNGEQCDSELLHPGVLYVSLPRAQQGTLKIV